MENNNILTKEEYQYLRSIDLLNEAIDKSKETNKLLNGKVSKIQKEFDEYRKRSEDNFNALERRHTSLLKSSNEEIEELKFENNELKKKIKVMLSSEDNTNEALKRQVTGQKREIERMSNLISNQEATIEKVRTVNADLEQYAEEIETRNSELEENCRKLKAVVREKKEDFESLNSILTDELSEKDKAIKNLKQEKINETPENKIKELLEQHNGRVPEVELKKVGGVTFDSGGIVKLALGGELVLKKNFLSPTFSLKN